MGLTTGSLWFSPLGRLKNIGVVFGSGFVLVLASLYRASKRTTAEQNQQAEIQTEEFRRRWEVQKEMTEQQIQLLTRTADELDEEGWREL